MGTVLITRFRTAITSSLTAQGLPGPAASTEAAKIAQLQGGSSNSNITTIPAFIRADFAAATRDVLFGMCIIMAIAALIGLRGLRRGIQEDTVPATEDDSRQLSDEGRGAALDPALEVGPDGFGGDGL